MYTDAHVYNFTPKHRWQVKLHFMSGITCSGMAALLKSHWRHIDWRMYWHRVGYSRITTYYKKASTITLDAYMIAADRRSQHGSSTSLPRGSISLRSTKHRFSYTASYLRQVLFLCFMSCINSIMAFFDWLVYSRAISAQQLHPEPLIILGHPRTGTTHLHNLLSQDPRFAYMSTFQAGFPSSFLAMRPFRWLLSPLLDKTRPMDNMALTWQLPAEDEIATTVLTGGISPYMAIVLPKQYRSHFRQYFTFEDAHPHDLKLWQQQFTWMMKKVTYSAGGCKPLLIKSPVHTARIKLLLQMFPRARFLYIHRHPIEVFRSAVHMADTYYWYTYLHQPSDRHVTDFVLDQYEELYHLYRRDKSRVPPGRLLELRFDELDTQPLQVLQRIYQSFGWGNFQAMLPVFQSYCSSLADFKKNHLSRSEGDMEVLVRRRWADSFAELGYQ